MWVAEAQRAVELRCRLSLRKQKRHGVKASAAGSNRRRAPQALRPSTSRSLSLWRYSTSCTSCKRVSCSVSYFAAKTPRTHGALSQHQYSSRSCGIKTRLAAPAKWREDTKPCALSTLHRCNTGPQESISASQVASLPQLTTWKCDVHNHEARIWRARPSRASFSAPAPSSPAPLSSLGTTARLAAQHAVAYASLGGRASPSRSVAGA